MVDAYAKMALWKHINNYDGHKLTIDQIKNVIPALIIDYSGKEVYIASNFKETPERPHNIGKDIKILEWSWKEFYRP